MESSDPLEKALVQNLWSVLDAKTAYAFGQQALVRQAAGVRGGQVALELHQA